ncbi:MAG: hypothetical protein OZ922_01420 [Myxococcales bacterium]|jgi:hypothetical protein|nr:hypothetical protein [Myxococcales bacterium]
MDDVERIVLPADDSMHENSGEENFNESAYYNFFDPRQRVGGFVRLGNRPNEGYAEMTVCFYLPDGRVAFMFERPAIASNAAHDAGGLEFSVRTPFVEHHITYRGRACLLTDPLAMADPGAAFAANPFVTVELDGRWLGLSPVYGGEPRRREGDRWVSIRAESADQEFAKGHIEQHGKTVGSLAIGGERFTLDAPGIRDRSWGPRYWQAPQSYRWLTMSFGEDLGAVPSLVVQRDGREIHGGYIFREGRDNDTIVRTEVASEYTGAQRLHDRLRVRATTKNGEAIEITGQVLSMIPLRNRRGGKVTRIAEGLTEWRWGDRIGYGLAEYLDHLAE